LEWALVPPPRPRRVHRAAWPEWKMSPREWGEAKTQFAIMFEDRFVLA
jgi:transposase-like protein